MINQVTLIGRVVEKPILKNYDGEFQVATLNLAVARPFKNNEGNIETDFIKVTMWNANAYNTCEYTDKGDIVGVKGRIVVKDSEISFASGNETYKKKIQVNEIVGERVIFIHSHNRKNIIPKDESYDQTI